jgi:DNA repair exonuclease SbcCD ATPase subunit
VILTTSTYRIQAIEVAGFKGFTDAQKVLINGQTTFIFGGNGLGKSSIVEAIVWCLYGTQTTVKNQLWQGLCSVSLYLMESENQKRIWRIQRKMHQTDNESDVDVFSPDGTRMNITDFVPQLKKLEHGPGARVIFAEQEPGRKYSHDLNNFEELIAAYLGLDVVYSIIRWLYDFVERQELDFDQQITSKEREISDELNERVERTHEQIKTISSDPPWQGPTPPSEGDTVNIARSFLATILIMLGEDPPVTTNQTLDSIVSHCNAKMSELEKRSVEDLAKAKITLEAKLQQATDLKGQFQTILQEVSSQENGFAKVKTDLVNVLHGITVASLTDERNDLQGKNYQLVNRANFAKAATQVITSETVECPLCEQDAVGNALLNRVNSLSAAVTAETSKLQDRIAEIEDLLNRIHQLQTALEERVASLGIARQKKEVFEAAIKATLDIQIVSLETVENKIIEFKTHLGSIDSSLQNARVKLTSQQDQLGKIRRTADYHRAIRFLSRIDSYRNSEDYKKMLAKISQFDQYMHSLKTIRSALEKAYADSFSLFLPVLGREMTLVYRQLTQPKSFDMIRLTMEPANTVNKTRPYMILEVGSAAKNVWVTPDKTDVLNGQASSALNLVPYFAFAKMGLSKHEIDFLLIDDPSQSFDTSHIDYLLSLLSNVSSTAQIIVATHERDRIEPQLKKFFGDYNTISVEGFDVDRGPSLKPHVTVPA